MKKILVSFAIFGAMTSMALADPPAKVTDSSLPNILAGLTAARPVMLSNEKMASTVGAVVTRTTLYCNQGGTCKNSQPGKSQSFEETNFKVVSKGPPQ